MRNEDNQVYKGLEKLVNFVLKYTEYLEEYIVYHTNCTDCNEIRKDFILEHFKLGDINE